MVGHVSSSREQRRIEMRLEAHASVSRSGHPSSPMPLGHSQLRREAQAVDIFDANRAAWNLAATRDNPYARPVTSLRDGRFFTSATPRRTSSVNSPKPVLPSRASTRTDDPTGTQPDPPLSAELLRRPRGTALTQLSRRITDEHRFNGVECPQVLNRVLPRTCAFIQGGWDCKPY